jgi:urease accessory protein
MVRALSVVAAGHSDEAHVRDTLLLSHDERRAPGGIITGLRGTAVEVALPAGTRLHHDDRLMLEDGGVVEIVARPEPLLEIRAGDTAMLARAAWLLGDHHLPVEIHARYLRVLQTDAAEDLLRTLGLTARRIEAPFEPEGGAYDHMSEAGA